jgi:NAD-dependent DNA ligase
MASKKPTMILLSKSDMTKEEIEALSEADAWKIIYSIRSKKAQDNRLQICFTGFGASRKQELSEIAERNNLKVVSSVTKNLDFLCGGENAGPKKVEKAELQGVQFLDELQFLNLIATGEIPNS